LTLILLCSYKFRMSVLPAQSSSDSLPGDRIVNVDALTRRRLGELERMFDVGMERLGSLSALGTDSIVAAPFRAANAFGKITTALRQITILERELLGLRKAPRRDAPPRTIAERMERGHDPMRLMRLSPADLDGRSGYSNGPLDKVVSNIRKVLDVPCPPDDPFSPDAEAKATERRETIDTPNEAAAAPANPKTAGKPDQRTLALKAAKLAIRANPRKGGFRRPKKTRTKIAMRPAVERHGQGPPG
jgi:hypothetical protein